MKSLTEDGRRNPNRVFHLVCRLVAYCKKIVIDLNPPSISSFRLSLECPQYNWTNRFVSEVNAINVMENESRGVRKSEHTHSDINIVWECGCCACGCVWWDAKMFFFNHLWENCWIVGRSHFAYIRLSTMRYCYQSINIYFRFETNQFLSELNKHLGGKSQIIINPTWLLLLLFISLFVSHLTSTSWQLEHNQGYLYAMLYI